VKRTGPSDSRDSSRSYGLTDEQLSTELRTWTGAAPALHPAGELLDRHWEAVFAYAGLCTDGAHAAGMLTTAAFTRLFGETMRLSGPTSAWRPRLLVTVRRIAAEWHADDRRDLLHPSLRAAAGDPGRLAALLLPRPERRLLSGAFQRLNESARCLLWHAEAESEPLAVFARLLGTDEENARLQLERARARFRDECLQLHRELAPDQECRSYLRMLDVSCRRTGVALDPDLRRHLQSCTHCRYAADQLTRFNDGVGTALAEAVLGWRARDYVAARAETAGEPARPGGIPPARQLMDIALAAGDLTGERTFENIAEFSGAGAEAFDQFGAETDRSRPAESFSHPIAEPFPGQSSDSFPVPRRSSPPSRRDHHLAPGPRHAAPRRRAVRRGHLVAGALGLSGLIVLPLVLWAVLGSDDDTGRTPPRAGGPASRTPGAGATPPGGRDPSWIGTGRIIEGALRGQLRNTASGLCVGLAGGRAVTGAEAVLAPCSGADDQLWTYETDGRLHNAADPELCLDSRVGYEVRLGACTGGPGERTDDVRYDYTVQGTLVPRSDQRLALAPAATDGSGALVLKVRTDDDPQRWTLGTVVPADPRLKAVHWDTEPTGPARLTGGRPR